MTDVERALRDLLERRAADVPPPADLYPAVRRRVHRRRTVLGAGVAAALVVTGVPAALAATRSTGPGPTEAATAAPTPQGAAGSAAPAAAGCPPAVAPSTERRLAVQQAVAGSLGGDRAAVDAVLRVAWAQITSFQGARVPRFDPGRARVHMVQRTADGGVVGLVTATGTAGGAYTDVLVFGPSVRHLVTSSSGSISGGEPLRTRFLGGDAYVGLTEGCGPPRVVVVGPPGSTARITWTAAVAADATFDRQVRTVPMRPDGVGVVDRPTRAGITVRVEAGGRTLRDDGYGLNPDSPRGPDVAAITRQLATAPGDGDPATALQILRQQYSRLPVDQGAPRVLWKGRGSGITFAVAVTTLAGGAHYLWGGAVTPGPGIPYVDGLVAADRLDGTAYAFRPMVSGGPWVVFFTGTRRVTVTVAGATRTSTVAGGLIVPGNARITVTDRDGTPVRLVDARTQLVHVPPPAN